MLVRIKRQKGPNEQPYWQTFEYKGSKDATVVTVLNALNYTDDLYDVEGNRMAMTDSRAFAFVVAKQNDFVPCSVHLTKKE